MSFVKLENLNDFIQPSTACVKPPTETKSAGLVAKVNDINLSDCLACSGCITSAETVLVQQQTHGELFKVINANKVSKVNKEIVVSLSLQTLSSLANRYSISAQDAAERIASFFISLGCHKVYDINLARHIALVESHREFKERRQAKTPKLPIISSVCPGWICYAEKTNGDLLIPYLSKVRSPQQIMGALVKTHLTRENRKLRSDIYHVTLMPCFDKKLEASRKDFQPDDIPDVDCVLTPIELEEILNEEGVDLLDFDRRKLDVLLDTQTELDRPLTSHFGSASGGYAENLLLAEAAENLSDKEQSDKLNETIGYSTLKNSDFIEVTLKSGAAGDEHDGTKATSSKFAIVNGFRNIQTIVQRLKRNALKYDYIEVMACPSGCINGGAQLKPGFGQVASTLLDSTRKIYSDVPQLSLNTNLDMINSEKLVADLGLQQTPEDIFYTDFHPVAKMQNLTVSW